MRRVFLALRHPRRTPISWLSLVNDRQHTITAIAGVAFAVFIMFVEVGFLNGVYDSQTDFINHIDGDLLIVNRLKEDFLPTQPFPRRRLIQALAVDGVVDAQPIYVEEYSSVWKQREANSEKLITAVGFDVSKDIWLLPAVAEQRRQLSLPDTALIDAKSRDLFGALSPGTHAELAGREIQIVGSFSLGPDFRSDGFLMMSTQNFLRYFPDSRRGQSRAEQIEIGVLRLAPKSDLRRIRETLDEVMPNDVVVLDKSALAARIKAFWSEFQPIGTVFGLGTAIGFLIGLVVFYQIVFTDINDNLSQFATLKALGYFDRYLLHVVLEKAFMLAVFGFVVGLVISTVVYAALETMTGIRMWLTPSRAVSVMILTVTMCMAAGALAVRRALRVDPAELF